MVYKRYVNCLMKIPKNEKKKQEKSFVNKNKKLKIYSALVPVP